MGKSKQFPETTTKRNTGLQGRGLEGRIIGKPTIVKKAQPPKVEAEKKEVNGNVKEKVKPYVNGNAKYPKVTKPNSKPAMKQSNGKRPLNKNGFKGKGPVKKPRPKGDTGFTPGLDIHRYLNAHDSLSTPKNPIEVTIVEALREIKKVDNKVNRLVEYFQITKFTKSISKEYNNKLHSLVDLINRKKSITAIMHKQNALTTITYTFEGKKYTSTVCMALSHLREFTEFLAKFNIDKDKTELATNPFKPTKKKMEELIKVIDTAIKTYNRENKIIIPK